MEISKKCLDLIKKYEGCRLEAYLCPANVWTIGYGHTAGVKKGMKITQEQAENLLIEDMHKYEGYVRATKLALNQNQFDALVSFTYNCGAGNLNKLIKGRSLSQIADAMLLYNKGGGKVLNGLVKRRKEERELFLLGIEENPVNEPVTKPQTKPDYAQSLNTSLKGQYKVVPAVGLNMRLGAGVNKNIVCVIACGEVVTNYGYYTTVDGIRWLLVQYKDYTGFCSSKYLKKL